MRMLLSKDIRLNRMVLLIGAAMVFLPYGIAAAFALNEAYASSAPIHRSWPNLLLAANHFCLMFWPVVAALLGGNAFACERADRSAEFLAYLPPSRRQIATSKLSVVLIATLVFWGLNLLLFWLGRSHIGDDTFQYLDLSEAAPKSSFAAIGVLTFGVGWLVSSVAKNTGPAAVIGLASPAVLFGLMQGTTWLFGWPNNDHFGRWFVGCGLSIGLLASVGGWHLYLSRREP